MSEHNKSQHNLNIEEHGEKENEERWLLTYADMITLLVAFFIMMYSMSVLNLEKFKELALSIKSGFLGDLEGKKGENVIDENYSMGIEKNQLIKENTESVNKKSGEYTEKQILTSIKEQINEIINNKKLQGIINLKEKEGNIYIVILTDQIFFKYGESELTEEAKEILKEIGKILKNIKRDITVEGYTSTHKLENTRFKNNWELSAARAISVIKFFEDEIKIEPERMSLTGYGEWRPFSEDLKDNKNDRVVIAIMQKKLKKVR